MHRWRWISVGIAAGLALAALSIAWYAYQHQRTIEMLDAMDRGDLDGVRSAVRRGANVNEMEITCGDPPLHRAVADGQIDIVEYLLRKGADPDKRGIGGMTTLMHVCCRPHANQDDALAMADLLLEHGAEINAQNAEGLTPLHMAVTAYSRRMGRPLLIEDLLDRGADPNLATGILATPLDRPPEEMHPVAVTSSQSLPIGWTPLHLAAYRGSDRVVTLLVHRGANPNAQWDLMEDTPLHVALATCGEGTCDVQMSIGSGTWWSRGEQPATLDTVRILLDAGADPNAEDVFERTPLHTVARLVEEWPDSHDNSTSKRGSVAGMFDQAHVAERALAMLLEAGADPNALETGGWSPLQLAARGGWRDGVAVLLGAGANLEQANSIAGMQPYCARTKDLGEWMKNGADGGFRYAVWTGDTERVSRLLDQDASPALAADEDGTTLLHLALWANRDKVARVLVEHRADVNAKNDRGTTPITCAAGSCDKETIRFLLDHGADIRAGSESSKAVLTEAMTHNTPEVVGFLVDAGLRIDERDKRGETPLLWAVDVGRPEMAALLIDKGATLDARDNSGWTALHDAVANGNEAIVRLLIEAGADVNILGGSGQTPLHIAAREGHTGICRMLLDHGADLRAVNWDQETPLDVARHERARTTAKQLEQWDNESK